MRPITIKVPIELHEYIKKVQMELSQNMGRPISFSMATSFVTKKLYSDTPSLQIVVRKRQGRGVGRNRVEFKL